MEIGKVKSQENDRLEEHEERSVAARKQLSYFQKLFNVRNRKYRTCIKIILGVVTNPIIFMTCFGVFCGTYVFPGEGNKLANKQVFKFGMKFYF